MKKSGKKNSDRHPCRGEVCEPGKASLATNPKVILVVALIPFGKNEETLLSSFLARVLAPLSVIGNLAYNIGFTEFCNGNGFDGCAGGGSNCACGYWPW